MKAIKSHPTPPLPIPTSPNHTSPTKVPSKCISYIPPSLSSSCLLPQPNHRPSNPSSFRPPPKPGLPLSSTDIDTAIDEFCRNGAEIKGYGKHEENMYEFPAEGQPQFYNNDLYKMHLTMGQRRWRMGDWCLVKIWSGVENWDMIGKWVETIVSKLWEEFIKIVRMPQ
ncbi:uncharacterized protein EAF01_000989 [Botrytis porri]|uniref:uncharacterized protein n=1 Tax=Botrytis porri TaxID=87229 RepID=UPI001901E757|nr:uncharacterized protein EAF01_000989 [Botrytis porri]KAF7914583.1 hypothetical protein EAF01_000989 [Botrytis porri]